MTAIRDRAPTFALPDTAGATHEPGGAPATVVVFTCNHCPYALAWHERLVAVARDYAERGVRMLAINPNDADRYPGDSLDAMRSRAHRGDFDGVPYLRDESQEVARAYDAKTTPDMDVKVVGQPDASKLEKGNPVRFTGTLAAFDPDPNFMLHWDKAKVNAEDLPKEKGAPKKPAAHKPAPKKKP